MIDLGSVLLNQIESYLRRYVVLTAAQYVAVVLWIVHTHAFEAAETTPYLSISSPDKHCGKTTLLERLELVVARAWLTGRVTSAVLARKVDAEKPTLLLDESDAAFKSGDEYSEGLRGLLNTGHRRSGKTTVCVGQGKSIGYRDFETFSPKAIAGIGNLPDTIADRSIRIDMKRKTRSEKIERARRRDVEPVANPLREAIAAWAEEHVDELKDARPELPEQLDDRAADGWEPLLAIADLAGGDWPTSAREAALELSTGRARDDDSKRVQLLQDIRRVYDETEKRRLATEALLDSLCADTEAPWATWHHGKPLSARGLAQLLKPYAIRSGTVSLGDDSTAKGYKREQFEDAWARYLPSYPSGPSGPASQAGLRPHSHPSGDPQPDGLEKRLKPA